MFRFYYNFTILPLFYLASTLLVALLGRTLTTKRLQWIILERRGGCLVASSASTESDREFPSAQLAEPRLVHEMA
jgi:hypothetical protein